MPEVKYFTVTQEREVRVRANTAVDACRIAEAAFKNGQNADTGVVNGPEGIYGNTVTRIKETSIYAREEVI